MLAWLIVAMLVRVCSTVGQALADRLGCAFFDGDDFHSKANKGDFFLEGAISDGQSITDTGNAHTYDICHTRACVCPHSAEDNAIGISTLLGATGVFESNP